MDITRRSWVAACAGLLLAAGACSTAQPAPAPAPEATRLAQSLALVPSSTPSATIMDLATVKQRWGLTAVSSQTDVNDASVVEYRRKLAQSGLGSNLLTYDAALEDAGWNGYDVETEIALEVDGPPVTLYRLRDSLDMQTVVDSFSKDGMVRGGSEAAPFFRSEKLGTGSFGQVFLSGVTVYPDRHLVVGGPEGSWTPPADGQSWADSADVQELVGSLGSADQLALDLNTGCVDPRAEVIRGGAEAVQRYTAALDAAGERQPVRSASIAVTGDGTAVIRTRYADAAAATADLPVRQKILQTIESLVSRRPYSDLFTAKLTAAGAVLNYDVTAERPSVLIQARSQRDTPWTFC